MGLARPRRGAKVGMTAILLLCSPTLSSADPTSLDFNKIFGEFCLETFPDVEKLKQLTTSSDFTPVTDALLSKVLGPSGNEASWQGWQFTRGRYVYFVGFAEGKFKGVPGQTCNLATYEQNNAAITQSLPEVFTASKQIEFVEAGTRTTIFELKKDRDSLLLIANDHLPSKLRFLNVTLTNDPRAN